MPRKRATATPRYANRTDLAASAGDTQPIQAPTGLPYGQRQQVVAAQQSQPLPGDPYRQALQGATQAATAASFPTGLMNAPTARPNEPITHGLSTGPGAGPEVLQRRPNRISGQLQALADAVGDSSLAELAAYAQQRGF